MSDKAITPRALAKFFSENTEKDKVINELFDFFKLDCLENLNLSASGTDELIQKFESSPSYDTELLASIIESIRSSQKAAVKREKQLSKEVASTIKESLLEDVSIKDIAKKMNISYYYMCHIFKNRYGVSPNQYRIKKRLELSLKDLLEGTKKIADIATSCGFNSVSYFTECFGKLFGFAPSAFKERFNGKTLHSFYDIDDVLLSLKIQSLKLCTEAPRDISLPAAISTIHEPDEDFNFLHEAAIIEYKGILYSAWYSCPRAELRGYTPILGRRSKDNGKSWSEPEIICEDKTGKIMYCPPIFGICDDSLYMMVNQMSAPDHIHSLDLYRLNEATKKFQLLWSRPIPFKLNTNVTKLPNGKLILPGRLGELDGFPITPAVMISDSGKIDAEWRIVKIAKDGVLEDGEKLVFPELSVMHHQSTLYCFCRNDKRRVPLVYLSKDLGDTWEKAFSHDVPYISSKVYAGNLTNGRKYLICNIDDFSRSRLAIYFTEPHGEIFTQRQILFDKDSLPYKNAIACHYPAAYEKDGRLYVIASLNYEESVRAAVLITIDIEAF